MADIPCPSAKVVNVYDSEKTDLGAEFDLSRIKISFSKLAPDEHKIFTIPSRTVHFVFVLQGGGQLEVGSDSGSLSEWDCFGFSAASDETQFKFTAGSEGTRIITFGDKIPRSEEVSLATVSHSLFTIVLGLGPAIRTSQDYSFPRSSKAFRTGQTLWPAFSTYGPQ